MLCKHGGGDNDISIHAPPRGATRPRGQPFSGIQFQFTPLREGRRERRKEKPSIKKISIHAPPRGATDAEVSRKGRNQISIHAPPRGATMQQRAPQPPPEFQFTPLREGRLPSVKKCNQDAQISIHAPPRGATQKTCGKPQKDIISIHAPPRGATKRAYKRTYARDIFQFTPLREGRPSSFSMRSASSEFQFTPLREGRHDRA